jgi:biopolymer transport protein ExbB
LLVAIVSLGFFGICRNRVDALTVTAHAAAMDLLEYFRPVAVGINNSEPPKPEPPAVKPPASRAVPTASS